MNLETLIYTAHYVISYTAVQAVIQWLTKQNTTYTTQNSMNMPKKYEDVLSATTRKLRLILSPKRTHTTPTIIYKYMFK